MLETTDTAEKLSDIQQYLPTEEFEFEFDLRRLGGARITRPTKSDTQAPLRRSAELLTASTERMQMFVAAYDQLHAREVGELARRTPIVEGILTADVMEAVLADPTMREGAIEYIEAGVEMYHYNSEASMTFGLFDGTVGFELNDGSGFVPAFIETDDEAVLAWAEEAYEHRGREAEPTDADAFAT